MTEREIAVVILAAGKGTRMKSDLPKVLHALAGRSMIGHVMATAQALAPKRIIVVVGEGMEKVAAAVAPVETVIQNPRLGTGHAVSCAREALCDFSGDVVVLYADTPLIEPATLERLVSALHDAAPEGGQNPSVSVLGFRPDDPAQYGRLVVGESGALEAIVEYREASPDQRQIDLCNSGVMAGDAGVMFELLQDVRNDNNKGEYYLTDVIELARARGLAAAYAEADADEVLGVNSRAELAVGEALLQNRLRAAAMAEGATMIDPSSVFLSWDTRLGRDVVIGPNVWFGPGVTVGDQVTINGFCHLEGASIEDGATIGPFARLRPAAEIGKGARVGNFVEVKKASLGAGAKANHLSYIGDASVGAGANIGAGTITCNYDGFNKFRTEIGEGAFIGSNTALVAPVKVGDDAIVGAGSVIGKDVPDGALGLARPKQDNRAEWARRFRVRKQSEKES
ncbi:MAG: bifunctional UDP-N-acetylglucosamine diphosphorylase/glucosamine-1-phosphate N-acetyltransferase GlmU [Sphingomonadales bacterium]